MRSYPRSDREFMDRALTLARKGEFSTTPNPLVGAVLVREGTIVGEGYHRRAGEPHAEVMALERAGDLSRGSVLYCNLEPCCVQGKTPPCTDAILAGGVRRVVAAQNDPNPNVAGRGIQILREAGITTSVGLRKDEALFLNRRFNRFMARRTPFVYLKWAATLDGCIAEKGGRSKWITGKKTRAFGKKLRNLADAVLVGSQTVIQDDPTLTRPGGRGPADPLVRVILDPYLQVSPDASVFDPDDGPVVVFCSKGKENETDLSGKGVKVKGLPLRDGLFHLPLVLKHLGDMGITSLLVEGGGETIGSFLSQGLADEGYAFYAAGIMGSGRRVVEGVTFGLNHLKKVAIRKVRRIENDILIHWMI